MQPEIKSPWKENSLPTLLPNNDLQNIYNAYEFGLFYQMYPKKSLHPKKEKNVLMVYKGRLE